MKKDNGFTLIEVLIVLIISAILAAGTFNTIIYLRTMSRDEILSKEALLVLKGFAENWQYRLLNETISEQELVGYQDQTIILDTKYNEKAVLSYGPITFDRFYIIPVKISWTDSQRRIVQHRLVAYQRRNE